MSNIINKLEAKIVELKDSHLDISDFRDSSIKDVELQLDSAFDSYTKAVKSKNFDIRCLELALEEEQRKANIAHAMSLIA